MKKARIRMRREKSVTNFKRGLTILCSLMMLLAVIPAVAEDGFSTSYTYTYDYWENVQESPDAYRVSSIIDSETLGLENLGGVRIKNPQSLFAKGNTLYVCDTDNNRILVIEREDNRYTLTDVIDEMVGAEGETVPEETEPAPGETEDTAGETEGSPEEAAPEAETAAAGTETAADENQAEQTEGQPDEAAEGDAEAQETKHDPNKFSQPYDVSVDNEGNIYIADYGNQRIVKIRKDESDRKYHFVESFIKPTDATFDQSLAFLPKKIVVDVAGRVYALCQNVNKGLVKYEEDASFSGFIGANTVSVSMAEYIWKRYFMTKEQRAQSESFVPTEYENIYIDKEGFIYATNTVFSEYDLKSDSAKPIRRLNSVGNDILIKNDRFPPIGDLDWVQDAANDNSKQDKGPSRFADITVLDYDLYVALDRSRGRIFGYDSQGILLWAFGTKGNTDGAFTAAVSVEHMGYDLFVLDRLKNNITVFTPTEYGRNIYEANEKYLNGDYDGSADLWREVLKMNSNYPLAFRGIGRAVLRQNRYEEAMDYFKLAHDRENYGRAFKLYRKEWIEKNVIWVVLILAVLLIIPLVIGRIKRLKWEVSEYERGKIHK